MAAAAVAAGAPLFGDGLRALRLSRLLPRLREVPLGDSPAGLVHVRGAVALESPLFSPLSGAACAGFRLEVRGLGTPVARAADVFPPFRVAAGGVSARVRTANARWDLSVTATREIPPDQPLTHNVEALLRTVPEALWLRRSHVTLRLTERALIEGAECHVIGFASGGNVIELIQEEELARTGTDDGAHYAVAGLTGRSAARMTAPGSSAFAGSDLRIDAGEHLNFLLISDRPPRPEQLSVTPFRLLGLAIGPALSLAGILYFASAADYLRTLGRP